MAADYDLDRLGATKFEKLCQALALREFGPGVEVYGAGPDGGRDATVQGLTTFPSPDAPWSGYTVIQMKFREHPRNSADDANWLIEQLGKELRTWADPEASRVRLGVPPDHFIIATNVTLTAASGVGGIDKVKTAMTRLIADLDLPIRDWQVWHRDKIRRLLDINADARKVHLPDLLPGDALADLYDRLSQHGALGDTGAGGLPREVRDLFGRDAEVLAGLQILEDDDGSAGRAIIVTGPPGIGKSAVALRISRLAADRFPDGQFHVDLALIRASGGTGDLTQALLSALRPDAEVFANNRVQQAHALRRVLSTSRVLILIDGLASEDALLDVLRMEGPFALVCTSQARLGGLTAPVLAIELGALPVEHGRELVRSIVGSGRLTNAQTSALAEACGGHPLALQVAASHLARRPKVDADRYLREITTPERGVRALRAGQMALQPVLERALKSLAPEQEQMLLRLGVLPHMSITTDIVAAANVPPDELNHSDIDDAAEVLDSLFELSLIEQTADDRYVLHSILHSFARLKSAGLEQGHQEAIVQRSCVVLAARADWLTRSIGFLDAQATVPASGNATALRELEADRPGMVAVVQRAYEFRLWGELVRLASNVTPYLWNVGDLTAMDAVYQRVLEAGEQSDNFEWKATALHNLGNVAAHRGDTATAADLYQQCADVARSADDLYFLHLAHTSTGVLTANLGRPHEAIESLRQDLPFWRITKNDSVLATVLGKIGRCYLRLGQIHRAREYLDNSAQLSQNIARADIRSSSAFLIRVGRTAEATEAVLQDLQRARALGNILREAEALTALSDLEAANRRGSEPSRALEDALRIYRDAGDAQGQVDVLMRLGQQASVRGNQRAAIAHLLESADLAHRIGNDESAALTRARLVKYLGGAKHHDEAEHYITQAQHMARSTGNPLVIADVQQASAEYLGHLGQHSKAVALLTDALGKLGAVDDQRPINSLRVSLAAALVESGQWREGEEILTEVTGAGFNATHSTRIAALRARGVLYSRRGLHAEAATLLEAAIDEAEKSGDEYNAFHCRTALAGAHARNEEWAKALTLYSAAAKYAVELGDAHVLITTQGMAAVCGIRTGAGEHAIQDAIRILGVAAELKMRPVELGLHNALGFYYAETDEHERAISEFTEAAAIASQLDDANGVAAATLNLARSHASMTELGEAMKCAREGFRRHQDLGNWTSAAGALRLLDALHRDLFPGRGDPGIADLMGAELSIDPRVGIAADSLAQSNPCNSIAEGDLSRSAVVGARRISLSASARAAMRGIELEVIMARLAESRQRCLECGLLIDEQGEGELIVLNDVTSENLIVRLAHTSCATSGAIAVDDVRGELSTEQLEAECLFLETEGGELAAVVIDAYNGWGSLDGGPIEDLVLRNLREAGFLSLRFQEGEETDRSLPLADLPTFDQGEVWADLRDNELVVSNSTGGLLPSMPLNFTPDWYQTAARGALILMVGRNLQGMVQQDTTYLRRAIRASNVVGGVMSLNVVRPRRNGPCPCEMRQGSKYKHCCEKRTTATFAVDSRGLLHDGIRPVREGSAFTAG